MHDILLLLLLLLAKLKVQIPTLGLRLTHSGAFGTLYDLSHLNEKLIGVGNTFHQFL